MPLVVEFLLLYLTAEKANFSSHGKKELRKHRQDEASSGKFASRQDKVFVIKMLFQAGIVRMFSRRVKVNDTCRSFDGKASKLWKIS